MSTVSAIVLTVIQEPTASLLQFTSKTKSSEAELDLVLSLASVVQPAPAVE